MGNGNQAKADVNDATASQSELQSDSNSDVTANTQKAETSESSQKVSYQSRNDYHSTYATPAHEDTKAGAVSVSDNKGQAANKQTQAVKTVQTVKPNIPARFNHATQVSNWTQFDRAIKNASVDQIVLDSNIDVNPRGGDKIVYSQRGIARTLEITSAGNNRYTMNFNRHFMGFFDQNQAKGTNWNLIFKNVDITSDNKYYGPLFTRNVNVNYSKRNTFTFDNVNFRGHEFIQADACNIVLAGKVNIDSVLEGGDNSAIDAYSVKIADGADVTMNVRQDSWVPESTTWNLGGSAAIKTMYNDSNDAVVIGSGAHFALNPNQAQTNIRGFVFADRANMIIAEGAKVEMNMGMGNSSAILAPRELEVRPTAVLDIKTAQDNAGRQPWGDDPNLSTHVAPISIGYWKAANGDSSFTIDSGAVVRIVRANSGRPTITPLISFGSNGENPYCNFNFNVKDDATLDLQDGAQATWHAYGAKTYAPYLGDDNQLQVSGLIAMYGIRSVDNLNFGNVKYVNLQRTGYQHGLLLRL